jgi:hypothetical protein
MSQLIPDVGQEDLFFEYQIEKKFLDILISRSFWRERGTENV